MAWQPPLSSRARNHGHIMAVSQSHSGIYKIEHIESGKCYVGSAKNVTTRWKLHRQQLKSGKHHSEKLQRAYLKYGQDAFRYSIIEIVPEPGGLIEREQYWIDLLDCIKKGYNIAPRAGSALGLKRSAVTKAKMRAIRQASPISPQQHHAMAEARKQSEKFLEHARNLHKLVAHEGHTDSTKLALSAAAKSRIQQPGGLEKMPSFKGKKHSQSARQQMSEKKRGVPLSPEGKTMLLNARSEFLASPEAKSKLSEGQKRRRDAERAELASNPDAVFRKKSSNFSITPEHRAKLDNARRNSAQFASWLPKLHASNVGRKASDATRKKLSDSLKAAFESKELRERISKASKGRKVSEETREKMRASALIREARKRGRRDK